MNDNGRVPALPLLEEDLRNNAACLHSSRWRRLPYLVGRAFCWLRGCKGVAVAVTWMPRPDGKGQCVDRFHLTCIRCLCEWHARIGIPRDSADQRYVIEESQGG